MFEELFNIYKPVKPPEFNNQQNTDIFNLNSEQNNNLLDFFINESDQNYNLTSLNVQSPFDNQFYQKQNYQDIELDDSLTNYNNVTPIESSYNLHPSKFNNQQEFVTILDRAYKKALTKLDLNPNYSTMLVAQDSIESGYGNKVKGNYNYGNIVSTKDDWHYQTSDGLKLRDFDSIDDYVENKIKLLQNKRYNFFNTVSPNEDVGNAMQYLANKGYAPGNSKYGVGVKNTYNYILRFINQNNNLVNIDIEDLLKSQGITEVNGKKLRFGSKQLRGNVSYGSKNSHHKEKDVHTGFANARDISIVGGTIKDYNDFRKILLNNSTVVSWLNQKGWGILNEITPQMLRKTKGTGNHFHFGPDSAAVRTLQAWLNNPNINVTDII